MAKKLIPFSLAEWEKQNRSIECLVCRNGEKPVWADWFAKKSDTFKMVLVMPSGTSETVDGDGRYSHFEGDLDYDLFIEIDVPDVIEVWWFNLYSDIFESDSAFWRNSKEKCDEHSDNDRYRDGYIKLTKNVTTGEKTIEIVPL